MYSVERNVPEAALDQCLKKMVSENKFHGRSVIITDQIFRRFGYDLSAFEYCANVIFVGFKELKLPLYSRFRGDVWILDSVLVGANQAVVDGDVFYVESHKLCRFKQIGGLEHVDKKSLNYYVKYRISHDIQNGALKLVEQEDLESILKAVIKSVPEVSFISYLDEYEDDNISVVYNPTDGTYKVTGDVILMGPLPFRFPNHLTLEHDLIIFDHLYQEWPLTMRQKGELSVRSYFLNLS